MKKLVLSVAVLFAGLVGSNAQMNMESVEVGARAGYNNSNLRGDKAENMDTKSLSGFHVGLFAEVPVSERFSIQPEVMYSTQGAKFELDDKNYNDLNLQYINIPVLAKVYVADGFNLQAGPQLSILTGSKSEGELLGISYSSDDVEGLKSTDFGMLLGAGYKTPMGLTIDARYNLGLSNIFDDDSKALENLGENNDFKNGVFQIGLGYSF